MNTFPVFVSCSVRITSHAVTRYLHWKRKLLGWPSSKSLARQEILHALGFAVPCTLDNLLTYRQGSDKWGFPVIFYRTSPWRFVIKDENPYEWIVLTIEPDVYPNNMGPWKGVEGVSEIALDPPFTIGDIVRHKAYKTQADRHQQGEEKGDGESIVLLGGSTRSGRCYPCFDKLHQGERAGAGCARREGLAVGPLT